MRYKRKLKSYSMALVTSLPIWAGILVVVLSVVLWQAQQRENDKEMRAMLTIQLRHVYNTVQYAIERQRVIPYKKRLPQLLGGDHYYGISMRIYRNGKLLFSKGKSNLSLQKRWGLQQRFSEQSTIHWRLQLWPGKALLNDYKTYLPELSLFMGLVVAVLLIMIGMLAILAAQREKAVQQVNRRLLRATSEKEKLERVLQQNQKLQAVGTLAGGIAHDFNNILYAMMGYVQMARDDVDESTIIYRNLGKVIDAGKRGQKLVSSILSFSRLQTQRDMQSMDLVLMLDRVFELVVHTIPTSIELVKKIQCKSAMIVGDDNALEQVMVNMINNAVDAMDGEGVLTVGLAPARYRDAYCIRIEDTGSGMTEETKQRLFDPFYTTKSVDKGTGLGLSMAHGIIRDHKGNIHVDTELGKGSTFSIYLPMITDKGEA